MTWSGELDAAAELATKRGSWHVFLFYLLCSLAAIPTSFLVFSQVFTNATPEHWCAPQSELEALGLSEELLKNLTIPGEQTYEECRAYTVDLIGLHDLLYDFVEESTASVKVGGVLRTVKVHQLKLTPAEGELQRIEQIDRITQAILATRSKDPKYCSNGWRYSTEHYTRTLVTDFSLFCDKDWIPRMSNTLFWVGSIFGNLFFGWMSDRYGRRPTILLMIFLEVPLSIAASFSTTYWGYAALRVAGGLFFPALYQLPFILALELMPPTKRTYTGIVVGMLFATGMCILALLAYAVRDWYHLSLVTSLPFILLYSYYWLIPESPRWLVGRGRIADAEKVFRNLARKNGIQLQRGFLLELHKKIKDVEEEPTTESEIAMLPNINGHIPGTADKEEYDRRISNMLTFKPDLSIINEEDRDLERIIALEVADIVNKKTRVRDIDDDRLNPSPTKSTQTDFAKSPSNSLRRKSIQLVTKIFIQDEGEEDVIENKRMDDQNSEGDCKASPLDVFRYPNIRKKFFLLTFDWIALGVVYNSLSYNSPNLGVDDYLAFFIGGAVELPSYFLAWRCMERFGRRWVLCICMCVGGLACLSCALVPEGWYPIPRRSSRTAFVLPGVALHGAVRQTLGALHLLGRVSWPWITVALAMLGRLCCASSFAVFYVLVGELLPTVLRAQAMAAASFLAGLALLTVPHIVYLAVYWRALPLTIMGVLSALGGVTSLFLPETLRQPLPQTLADGEAMGRRFKVLSCVEPEEKR